MRNFLLLFRRSLVIAALLGLSLQCRAREHPHIRVLTVACPSWLSRWALSRDFFIAASRLHCGFGRCCHRVDKKPLAIGSVPTKHLADQSFRTSTNQNEPIWTHVFGRLLHEPRLSEEDLRGLQEDKLKLIRSFATFLTENAA
jgi:hypothetical protein